MFVLPLRAWRFAGKGKVVPNDNRHLNVVWVWVGGLIRGASMWNQPCCVSQLWILIWSEELQVLLPACVNFVWKAMVFVRVLF